MGTIFMGVWGLAPGKISHFRNPESMLLDTFTMLLK